jgi:hypothetical protein
MDALLDRVWEGVLWLRATDISFFFRDSYWSWPILETLHFTGMALLIGAVGLFDLRVLGMAKAIPPAALHRLIPWGIAGLALNVITGTLFFIGYPDQYTYNPAFHFKLGFLVLAGLNIVAFYGTAFAEVKAMPAGADAPLRSKVITAISLGSWVSVIVCGRLLTFFRPAFAV